MTKQYNSLVIFADYTLTHTVVTVYKLRQNLHHLLHDGKTWYTPL